MEFLGCELEKKFSNEELIRLATLLDRCYKVSFFWNGWKTLEKEVFSSLDLNLNQLKENYHYREIYNYIIMKYGKTEKRIKYYLTKEYLENIDEVCLYEFVVGASRLDFGRINGSSYAYEIKTELDSVSRLESQITDYRDVFDYITVVIHKKHLKKVKALIPRTVGIMVYYDYQDYVDFDLIRPAKRNIKIKKTSQLELLNSNDLKYIIQTNLQEEELPLYKNDRYRLVRKSFLKENFNDIFKDAMKYRHNKKWAHIKNNFDKLMPIEVQKVYTHEIEIKTIRS